MKPEENSLYDSVPVGLYRTHRDGRILLANNAAVQMLGFPNQDALMEKKITDLLVDTQIRHRLLREVDRDDRQPDHQAGIRGDVARAVALGVEAVIAEALGEHRLGVLEGSRQPLALDVDPFGARIAHDGRRGDGMTYQR